MADQHQVKCINNSDCYDPDKRIQHIGGTNQDSTRWKISQQEAIAGIETGKWSFYVSLGG